MAKISVARLRANEIQSVRISGSNNPKWKGGLLEKSCKLCGNPYQIRRDRAEGSKFCSRNCQRDFWTGRSRPISDKARLKISLLASKRNEDPHDRFGRGGTVIFFGGDVLHSTYELRYLKAARSLGLKVERNSDRFPYIWKSIRHWYTPDFKVSSSNGMAYVEVKGEWGYTPKTFAKIIAVQNQGVKIYMIGLRGIKLLEREAA